jgi:hypothetical protein
MELLSFPVDTISLFQKIVKAIVGVAARGCARVIQSNIVGDRP